MVVCLAQLKPSLGVLSVFLHIDHLGWSSTSHRQMKQNVGGGWKVGQHCQPVWQVMSLCPISVLSQNWQLTNLIVFFKLNELFDIKVSHKSTSTSTNYLTVFVNNTSYFGRLKAYSQLWRAQNHLSVGLYTPTVKTVLS